MEGNSAKMLKSLNMLWSYFCHHSPNVFRTSSLSKVMNALLRSTVLLHFCRFVAKHLNDYFIIKCLTFFYLISPKQSGFRPGDSCINQLLWINHKILSAFGRGLEVWGLFLDISKAFDKAWYAGLVYKLRQNSVCGDWNNIINHFLIIKKQRAVLYGKCSSCVDIRAGVPQGSIHRSPLCLIYVLPNDICLTKWLTKWS